jgi:hypothetical protein
MHRRSAALLGATAAAAALASSLLVGGGVSAQAAPPTAKLTLQTSSPELAKCFPHAKANVNVALTTDAIGKDTFKINASGLKPKTAFTVFLLQQAGAPFGAAEYIGDFFTDRYGKGSGTFNLIVEEAFAFNNQTGFRKDLNSVGFWFADEKADDSCLGAASPVTGFDGDAKAGVQMMNSGTWKLP